MKWISIVFMQDSQDFEAAEKVFNEKGFTGLLEYLMQWHTEEDIDYANNTLYDNSPSGNTDSLFRFKGFEVSINLSKGYCGLSKEVSDTILEPPDCTHSFVDCDNNGGYGKEECRFCGKTQKK